MKLAYLSFAQLLSRSANAIQTIKMCSAFASNNIDVTLLNISFDGTENINDSYSYYGVEKNFVIKKVPFKKYLIRNEFLNGKVLFDEAKKSSFDILYSRSLNASFFASFNSIPHIFESHVPPNPSKGMLYFPSQEFIFNRIIKSKSLIKLVVISSSLKEYYRNKYLDKIKIEVHPDSSDEIKSNMEKVVLPGNNSLKVGYLGQLYSGKGAEIIPYIAMRLPEFDFHLVGGNEEQILYYKNTFKLPNLFIHGFIEPSKTYLYLNSFDIVLAPYQWRISVSGGYNELMSTFMSPLKIFEYMSAKKVIVASNLPVIQEVLNKNNSILVNPENIDAWVKALISLKKYETREVLSTNAYNDFINNYTYKIRAKRILNGISN
jgi:glycosyltransferase involved in cell wall biosynthesis